MKLGEVNPAIPLLTNRRLLTRAVQPAGGNVTLMARFCGAPDAWTRCSRLGQTTLVKRYLARGTEIARNLVS